MMPTTGLRVLVTGAAGFIGAHLLRCLVAEGHEVHAAVRGASPPVPPGVRVHALDLLDAPRTMAAVKAIGPAVVFHLAGRVDLERSGAVARACIDENLTAHVNLLEALREVPPQRLVYTSSAEVYGANPPPFREDQPVDPPSPYAVSKVAAEHFCRIYGRLAGFDVCVARLAPAYGPGQPSARFVPSMVMGCLRGEPIRVRHPHQRRDFVYVGDLADGILRAGTRPLGAFEIVNLGSEDTIALGDLARQILDIAGFPDVPVERGNEPRPNETSRWGTSAEKARRLLGWRPETALKTGLAATVTWYRERFAARGSE